MDCFAHNGDDLDLDWLFEQDDALYEPSIEDLEIKSFAQSGVDIDFSGLL
jgi:hypothetical protein